MIPAAKAPQFRIFPSALRALLAGYLFFSKPFAYVHLPGTPLFVGEIVLLIGVGEAFWIRAPMRQAIAGSAVLKALLAFMAWCAVRLSVSLYVGADSRMDAIRDSAIWYYGTYAFLVAVVAYCDATFIESFLGWFRRITPWFIIWAPLAVVLQGKQAFFSLTIPGSDTPIFGFKPSDMAVSCVMVVTFLLLGLRREGVNSRPTWSDKWLIVIGFVGIVLCGAQTRGGFLGAVLALGIVFWGMSGERRRRTISGVTPVFLIAVLIVVVFDPHVQTDRRKFSTTQLVTNLASIFGHGDKEQEGTVEWRKAFWSDVLHDSLSEKYIVAGQGFGPNLYYKYRSDAPDAVGRKCFCSAVQTDQVLRNPHNSHLDILARTGMTGLVLWLLLWGAWCSCAVGAFRQRRRRPKAHRDISLWLSAGIVSALLNAFFDPALEAPHAAIWLWVVVGFGGASFRRTWRRIPPSARQSGGVDVGPSAMSPRTAS